MCWFPSLANSFKQSDTRGHGHIQTRYITLQKVRLKASSHQQKLLIEELEQEMRTLQESQAMQSRKLEEHNGGNTRLMAALLNHQFAPAPVMPVVRQPFTTSPTAVASTNEHENEPLAKRPFPSFAAALIAHQLNGTQSVFSRDLNKRRRSVLFWMRFVKNTLQKHMLAIIFTKPMSTVNTIVNR
jgi:hypothetical protein